MFQEYHSLCVIRSFAAMMRFYSKSTGRSYYDVIISGGGMVGQVMACSLAKNPLLKNKSLLLIESVPQKQYKTPELHSNRVSSIAPCSKELLNKLGIWKGISRYQEVKDIKVWGSYSENHVHFTHDTEKPSFIVENDEIINAALEENKKQPNLNILFGKSISQVNLKCNARPLLHETLLNDTSSYKTFLLIGADGANSAIRNSMQINYIAWKYHQYGVVATLKLQDDFENSTAWQKFLPGGPIAILPLANGISSLVWSVPEEKSKVLSKLPDETFVDALNEAIHSQPIKDKYIDNVNEISKSILKYFKFDKNVAPLVPPFISSVVNGSRAAFPLSFGHSSEYVKPGVALIGDSAHKVHPLAGQGVNIGFRDIRCLNENISRGIMEGRPLGHLLDLKHYETEAQRANIPLMAAIDLFHKAYTSNSTFVRGLGNLSILVAESVSPLKNAMKYLATN